MTHTFSHVKVLAVLIALALLSLMVVAAFALHIDITHLASSGIIPDIISRWP